MTLRTLILLLAAVPLYAVTCPTGTTHIVDTKTVADGTAAFGKILAKGPTAPSGSVLSTTVTIPIGSGGAVDFCLAGGVATKYTATYLLTSSTGRATDSYTEAWIVPATSSVLTIQQLWGGPAAPQYLVNQQQMNPAGLAPGQFWGWNGTAYAAQTALTAASPIFTGQPTIPDFTLAPHTHLNAAGGGALDAAAIASGLFNIARLPTGVSGATVAFGNHTHTGVYEPANANIQTHVANVTTNPHAVTKAQVGLGSVDNTADAAKPISTAETAALALKLPVNNPVVTGTLVVGTPVSDGQQVGVLCSGNITTTLQAAVNAIAAAGGGRVSLTAGSCYSTAQITFPNDAATQPKQVPIKLVGAGSRWDGSWGSGTVGATILDLRYSGAVAKIDTRGLGVLAIEDIAFSNSIAADSTPFIQTTNTTLFIRRNSFTGSGAGNAGSITDAIVLGSTTINTDGTATAAFQGYGTVIEQNSFLRIRRGVYAQTYANGVVISANTWATNCGADNTAAAIEFDGTANLSDMTQGNVISGNLIEMQNYVYGVNLKNTKFNTFANNTFWDFGGSFLAVLHLFGTTSTGHTMIGGTRSGATDTQLVLDSTGTGNVMVIDTNGLFINTGGSGQGMLVRPGHVGASENAIVLTLNRPEAETTNPNGAVFKVRQNGLATLTGLSASPGAGLQIINGSATTTYDNVSAVLNTGNYSIYPGTGGADTVVIGRGYFRLPSHTTAARTAASNAGAGGSYYDTTLGMPLWSDGTNWKDAAGTIR